MALTTLTPALVGVWGGGGGWGGGRGRKPRCATAALGGVRAATPCGAWWACLRGARHSLWVLALPFSPAAHPVTRAAAAPAGKCADAFKSSCKEVEPGEGRAASCISQLVDAADTADGKEPGAGTGQPAPASPPPSLLRAAHDTPCRSACVARVLRGLPALAFGVSPSVRSPTHGPAPLPHHAPQWLPCRTSARRRSSNTSSAATKTSTRTCPWVRGVGWGGARRGTRTSNAAIVRARPPPSTPPDTHIALLAAMACKADVNNLCNSTWLFGTKDGNVIACLK